MSKKDIFEQDNTDWNKEFKELEESVNDLAMQERDKLKSKLDKTIKEIYKELNLSGIKIDIEVVRRIANDLVKDFAVPEAFNLFMNDF